MVGQGEQSRSGDRLIKIAFGVAALICLAGGLFIYLFPDIVGLDEETAELVAIAFLLAGAFDYLVLRFWDKLVRRR
ncbi:MAG: hypothetical protein AAGF14_05215 [Pseudomonadota bacterium]